MPRHISDAKNLETAKKKTTKNDQKAPKKHNPKASNLSNENLKVKSKSKTSLKDFIYHPTSASQSQKPTFFSSKNHRKATVPSRSYISSLVDSKEHYLTTLINDEVLHMLVTYILVKKSNEILFNYFLKILSVILKSKNLILLTSIFYRNNLFGVINSTIDELQH